MIEVASTRMKCKLKAEFSVELAEGFNFPGKLNRQLKCVIGKLMEIREVCGNNERRRKFFFYHTSA